MANKKWKDDPDKPIPYKFTPDDEIEIVMDAFRIMFGPEVDKVTTKDVRIGPTSCMIYLPKKYHRKRVTVIIWKNKERYYKDGKVVDNEGNEVKGE
jgi:putative transposon-encoded protein